MVARKAQARCRNWPEIAVPDTGGVETQVLAAAPGSAVEKGHLDRQGVPEEPSELTLCAADPKPDVSYGKIRLPAFRQEAFFRSKRPRYNSDITIVTQCSLDRYTAAGLWILALLQSRHNTYYSRRLHMLESQCRNWGGITSTVVYFPLAHFSPDNEQQLEEARAKLEEFHTRMDSEGKLLWCHLRCYVTCDIFELGRG